jgi:hypothetical protein
LTLVRKAPWHFILTRAAWLSLDSSQSLLILRPAIPWPHFVGLSISYPYLKMRLLCLRDAAAPLWAGDFVMLEFAYVR